jgi:hypothetical protein
MASDRPKFKAKDGDLTTARIYASVVKLTSHYVVISAVSDVGPLDVSQYLESCLDDLRDSAIVVS